MSERCRECQKRPARRRGLCVYCVRAADDKAYMAQLEDRKQRLATKRRRTARERERQRHEQLATLREDWRREPSRPRLLAWALHHDSLFPTPAEDIRQRTELDALVDQQEREQRRSHFGTSGEVLPESRSLRTWLSLDQIAGQGTAKSDAVDATLADTLTPTHDPFEPQAWVEARLLDEIVGDRSITDILQMTEEQLERLRARLVAEGFTGRAVQRKERERLRIPQRHRGDAPPPMFQRMAPRHRGRRERIIVSGKRTSHKQRGRWNREKVVW